MRPTRHPDLTTDCRLPHAHAWCRRGVCLVVFHWLRPGGGGGGGGDGGGANGGSGGDGVVVVVVVVVITTTTTSHLELMEVVVVT